MKLYLPCVQCTQQTSGKIYNSIEVEYAEEGYYHFVCPNGHDNFIILQEQKFETLFQIGGNAILDGYYREAVSSFTSALERFYEFCVQIFCHKHKIDEKQIEDCRKFYKNSSERQFGSFLFLYLQEFKEIPFTKNEDDKWRKFRNDVIHNGRIPTKNEAIEYGNMVRKFILTTILKLRNEHNEELNNLILKNTQERGKHNTFGCPSSTMCNPNLVSLVNGELEKELNKDFITCLEDMNKMNNAFLSLHKNSNIPLF